MIKTPRLFLSQHCELYYQRRYLRYRQQPKGILVRRSSFHLSVLLLIVIFTTVAHWTQVTAGLMLSSSDLKLHSSAGFFSCAC